MKLRPLRDNVVLTISTKKTEDISKGGVIIPESAVQQKRAPHIGVVEAIGPDVTDVKVGDKVYFQTSLTEKFEDIFIIKEELIIGIHDAD